MDDTTRIIDRLHNETNFEAYWTDNEHIAVKNTWTEYRYYFKDEQKFLNWAKKKLRDYTR